MNAKLEARPLLLSLGTIAAVLFFIAGYSSAARAVTVITDMEGRLVKGSSSEVYFLGSDSKRYLFPNEKIFFSWYKDFSSVQILTDDELKTAPVGGVVTYKPGARLVKIPSDPKVYAVTGDGELRWVQNEDVAKAIFGDNWAKQVDDVSGTLFADYQLGAVIASAADYSAPGASSETPTANPPANVVAPGQFAFSSIDVGSVDSKGKSADDVRSFRFAFNQPYAGGRLTITEKASAAVFRSEPFPAPATADAKSVTIYPDDWTAKLKSSTAYVWQAIAYAAPNASAAQTANVSSEFTTADFATHTLAPESAAFKVVSVRVDKADAQGQPAEDVRTFGIVFSAAAKGVRLQITEKDSSAPAVSVVYNNGAVTPTEISIGPGDWGAKLKPNTDYAWKIIAYAAITSKDAPYQYDVATGEFKTSDFAPQSSATAPEGNSALAP